MQMGWTIIAGWLATLAIITCRVALPRRLPRATRAPAARYTLIRICGGPEPHLVHNLLSARDITGIKPTHTLLVVPGADPQRAAVEKASRSLAAHGCPATVLATDVCGANHKVAQMAAAFSHWPKHEDVVCADGDVDLSHYPMDALRAPLQNPQQAAVWAPCAELADSAGKASAAAVLASSLQCFALLGRLDKSGMVGKLWATRSAHMVRAGGWQSLVDTLGEDMELARRFRRLGLKVSMASPAWSRPAPRSHRDAVARYARWFWVIRAQRPHLLVTYPTLFFGTSGIVALCALQAVQRPWLAGAVATVAVLLRLMLTAVARRVMKAPNTHLLRDTLLSECTILAAFVCMLCQRTVRWRHQRLQVRRGGRIAPTSPILEPCQR